MKPKWDWSWNINLIRKVIGRNGIRMLFIYNLTIYCIFLISRDDCWNYKGKESGTRRGRGEKAFYRPSVKCDYVN